MNEKDREKLKEDIEELMKQLNDCGQTFDDISIGDRYNDVSYPVHYRGDGSITCMDAINSMMTPEEVAILLTPNEAYWWGCAFKYVWRWPLKNGTEDIEKAIQCLKYILQLRRSDNVVD